MTAKKKILEDHQRIGKKFIPPMKKMINKEIHYVENLLPEISWINYFIIALGQEVGAKAAIDFMRARFEVRSSESPCEVALLTSYNLLSAGEWVKLRQRLEEKGLFDSVRSALLPFVRTYPKDNPFENLYDTPIEVICGQDVDLARRVIRSLFDRRSEEASITQIIIHFIHIDTGKHTVNKDFKIPDIKNIFSDFSSEEAQEALAHARMNLNAVTIFQESPTKGSWASYFWNCGRALVPLETDYAIPHFDDNLQHPLVRFGVEYEIYVRSVLKEIWGMLPVDIHHSEFFEVIGALMSRQCTLSIKIVSNLDLWDCYSAPLFMRAMVDCYITAAWILKDPLTRAEEFIDYGLGQEKLRIEHLKTKIDELENEEERDRLQQEIDIMTEWLNSQHYHFLQDVNIGSWSGTSTRKMAEEADCLSLYQFAYVPWSSAAHGSWNHIGRYDSFMAEEPLHKHIRQPFYFKHQEFHFVDNAVKYLNDLLVLVVSYFKLEMDTLPPKTWLASKRDELFRVLDEYQEANEAQGSEL
ncbi:MAG: DUF5677 domain-containing protein [Desulfuromonadales bacterium]|nr:DUF5677 domain-containing protein [Desulfuromonadales bacterium]